MCAAFNQRFAKGLASQGVSQLAQAAITLLLMPLVIKTAGVGVYGGYVVLSSLITLTTTLLSGGVGFKCRRALPSAADARARADAFLPSASVQLGTTAVSAFVLALALPWLNRAFFNGEISAHPLTVALAAFALYSVNLTDDYFRYTHQIPLLAKAVILRAMLQPALVLAAAAAGVGLDANLLIALQATAWLVVSAGLWWRIHREIPLQFRFDGWSAHAADLRLGFPLVSAVIVENLLAASDRYILAGYLSPAEVGAYAAAATVGGLVLMLPRIANSALLPALAQATDTGREQEAQALLREYLQVFFMLSLPFVIGAALLGGPVLVWLGNAEVAALAGRIVPLMAFAGVLYGYCYLKFNALFVNRQTTLWFRANVAAALVSISLNLILVGWARRLEAAALVAVASYAVAFLIIRSSASGWKLRLNRAELGRAGVATAGMAAVIGGLRQTPFFATTDSLRITALVAVGVAVYFSLLSALGGYTPRRFIRALGF